MIKLGLRIRFFLYSNTLIAVTMTLVAVLGTIHERRTLYEAIVSRGRSLAEAMAIPISGDAMGLQDEAGDRPHRPLCRRDHDPQPGRHALRDRDRCRGDRVTHASAREPVGGSFDRALTAGRTGEVQHPIRGSGRGRRGCARGRTPLSVGRVGGRPGGRFSLRAHRAQGARRCRPDGADGLDPDARQLDHDRTVRRDTDPPDPQPQPDDETGR